MSDSHALAAVQALHGDISQAQREKILQKFREDKFSVLVATDVAARGLDIPNVELVVHYDLPDQVEGFLHRYSLYACLVCCIDYIFEVYILGYVYVYVYTRNPTVKAEGCWDAWSAYMLWLARGVKASCLGLKVQQLAGHAAFC